MLAEKEELPNLPGEARQDGTTTINSTVEPIPPSSTNFSTIFSTNISEKADPPSESSGPKHPPESHPPPACLYEEGKCVQHKCTLLQKYLKTEINDDSTRKAYAVKRIWVCPVINSVKFTKPRNFASGEAEALAQGLILRKAKIRKRR